MESDPIKCAVVNWLVRADVKQWPCYPVLHKPNGVYPGNQHHWHELLFLTTMTLRSSDGKWSLGKIGILAGILASVATCVIALPIVVDYTGKAIAPWTELPRHVDEIQKSVDEIRGRLRLDDYEEGNAHGNASGTNYSGSTAIQQ